MGELLEETTRVVESRYYARIQRYYNKLRADMMSCVPAQPHPPLDPKDPEADPF